MKRLLVSMMAVVTMLTFQHCGSDDEDQPTPGGGSGDVKISSVTPETFYADDELTITGEGFGTDPAKVIVEMGNPAPTEFMPFSRSFDSDPSFQIVSVTNTKIVAKAVDAKVINYNIDFDGEYRVRVTIGDKTGMGAIKHSRHMVNVVPLFYTDVINRRSGCFLYIQAGDSVKLGGNGFYGDCKVMINDKPIAAKVETENKILIKIPKNLFGELNDNCTEEIATVKVTNGDGKTFSQQFHIATSPPMYIDNASFDKPQYAGNEPGNLTVRGYSFYSSATVAIFKQGTGMISESKLGVSGYPDQAVVPFQMGNFGPGIYEVRIRKDEDTDYPLFPIADFKKN